MRAIVEYKKALAYFNIEKERPGIYQADLVYYDGNEKNKPPTGITLIRGIREWSGSERDKNLLNGLGRVIDESFGRSNEEVKKAKP